MGKAKSFLRSNQFVTLVWVFAIVLVWESTSFVLTDIVHDKMVNSKLPYLHGVLATIATNALPLARAAATTLSRAIVGFAVGALVGFLLALFMSLFRPIEKIAYPYLLLSQMIPILGLAPVVISIVHKVEIGSLTIAASDITRVIIAAYITFFPVATNMLSGLKAVDKDKRDLMYMYAAGKPTVYAKLMLPFSIPFLFSGLKIAAPLAVTASILVDSLGAAEGIGYNLTYALYTGTYSIFWASVLISAAMGILGYYAMVLLETACMPWKRAASKGGK
jgi:NitT/TauT family transport system permease protein